MQILKSFFSALGAGFKFINTYFKSVVLILILLWIFMPKSGQISVPPNLERIDLNSAILNPSAVLEKLQNAKENPHIKGVLFVIDSPGGAFAPSMEIALAIKDLKEKKPVVSYAAGTMASGSYLAGVLADKIYANPASFIGSIGVIMQGANIAELAQKLGIEEQTISAGEFKEAGTFTRKWKESEKKYLQNLANESYALFVEFVANARGLDLKKQNSWANARVFLANKAKKLNLIDEIGNLESAKIELIKLSGVEKAIWKSEDKFEKFLNRLNEQSAKFTTEFFHGILANNAILAR